eukprot:5444600-Amphidinium_carterae.1
MIKAAKVGKTGAQLKSSDTILNILALETATKKQSQMPRCHRSFGPTSTDRRYLELAQARAASGFARKSSFSQEAREAMETVTPSYPPSPPYGHTLSEEESTEEEILMLSQEIDSPREDGSECNIISDAARAALIQQMASVAARLAAFPTHEAEEAVQSHMQPPRGMTRQCSIEVQQHQALLPGDHLIF